jgi:vitamin B12 transporter
MARRYTNAVSNTVGSVLFILISQQLCAEEVLELDDLLVTAGLQAVSMDDVASSVTVITREEIEQKQFKFLSDLLRDVPGFSVSQAGGAGSQTQVRVRGAEANQLLVLVDGIRANDPANSDEFQYQYALTSNIERIEIIRGPQSATWGSDAMAGVINIIRKKNSGSQDLVTNFETGSFGSINASVDGGYAGKVFQFSGGLSYLDASGTNISRTGDEKDGVENTTANIALVFDADDAFNVRFSSRVVDATSEYDDIDYFVTGLPVDADRETEFQQTFLSGEIGFKPPQGPWSGSLSVNRVDSDKFRLRGGLVFGERQSHHISFALEREDVDFSQRGEASFYGDPNQDQSYDVNGYALEYVGKPFTGFAWTISGRLDDYSEFDDASTWQLAASYQLSPALRLRGSTGTGSKTPTFTERYGFFADLFLGNPELKPESSRAWEFGFDTSWSDDRFQMQLAYFNQDLQDEIDSFVFDPVTFLFTALNKKSDSSRKGFEAVVDMQLGESFTLATSYTYTDATEKNSAGQVVREVRRPEHLAAMSANYHFANDRGNLNMQINYSGAQKDVFFSPVTFTSDQVNIDSYTILDLAASWQLGRSLQITGRVSNLLDEEYEEILGFVRPGRAIYVGLRGMFGF